ncbi:hypothetical protein Strain138_000999 [Pseudogemmatithrix spongiicola]|uniref:Uncharacterized protein n=1 Tax=Pseudogemmatithrix spongiicola TaxID=3062599 RepID=A0AA49JTI3_9BACT|nr:hypothetical protein Strain138_000999 [Gemmatimonadaceae bacterium 'strain 138']WKW14647.1 hypothetical protein Strain318_000999 [Gemmatimonadaceae bacterium 'strain 318']
MRLAWHVTATDVRRIKTLMAAANGLPIIEARRRRNLATQRPRISLAGFWHGLCGALLTTQQKAGPNSAVTRLLATRPFPLSIRRVEAERNVAPFVTRTLKEFGGIRRSTVIGRELATNYRSLSGGLWDEIDPMLARLTTHVSAEYERDVANFLADQLLGIGPKQSRNLLQGIGLTRYEIPLDSRLAKWLNDFGFPVKLNATALADRYYYQFVSDGVQALCKAANVAPCLFDAAVFASFDADEWSDPKSVEWGYDGD